MIKMRMRSLPIVIAVVLLTAMNCSLGEDKSEIFPVTRPEPTVQKVDLSIQELKTSESLKKDCEVLKLENLKDIKLLQNETEIRLWRQGGIAMPICFIYQRKADKNFAHYAFPIVKKVNNTLKITVKKVELNEPKSGWNYFENYLRQEKIEYPLIYSFADNGELDNTGSDESNYNLEIKNGDSYDVASYPMFTEDTNGKKLSVFFDIIKNEFSLEQFDKSSLELTN
jgi:hypothetical protein